MQIERDEFLRTFQAFTNRYPSPYQASYSNNPLYYSQNIGRESPNNPAYIHPMHQKSSALVSTSTVVVRIHRKPPVH